MSQGFVGGEKNGIGGKVVGSMGTEGISLVGSGGNLTSGYAVSGRGGKFSPGMLGKKGAGFCNKRRAAKAPLMLENDRVIKKAKVMK